MLAGVQFVFGTHALQALTTVGPLATRPVQQIVMGRWPYMGYPAAALLGYPSWIRNGIVPSAVAASRQRPPQPAAKRRQAGEGERWKRSGAPANRICSGFFVAQPSPQRHRRRRTSDRCDRFPLSGRVMLLAIHCIPSATGTGLVDFRCGLPSCILRIQKHLMLNVWLGRTMGCSVFTKRFE